MLDWNAMCWFMFNHVCLCWMTLVYVWSCLFMLDDVGLCSIMFVCVGWCWFMFDHVCLCRMMLNYEWSEKTLLHYDGICLTMFQDILWLWIAQWNIWVFSITFESGLLFAFVAWCKQLDENRNNAVGSSKIHVDVKEQQCMCSHCLCCWFLRDKKKPIIS